MSIYFDDIQATLENVLMIYCTNNLRWNIPGGYCASSTGWFPQESWNNLERSWYQDAKKAQGNIAFTMPYIDAATGKLIFAMARTVFDKDLRDLGVVSENVSIETMGNILNEYIFMPQQQTFLITQEGLFITNPDESAVMTKDLFAELGLERYRNQVLSAPSFSQMDEEVFISSSLIPKANWFLVYIIPKRNYIFLCRQYSSPDCSNRYCAFYIGYRCVSFLHALHSQAFPIPKVFFRHHLPKEIFQAQYRIMERLKLQAFLRVLTE